MTYDERDRADVPDEGAAPSDEGAAEAPSGADTTEPLAPAEPAAPTSPSGDEPAAWPESDSTPPAPAEAPTAWSTEPPAAGEPAPEAWPTTPPEAGESRPDAWPTTPPERGGEPILEPVDEMEQPPGAFTDAAAASTAGAAAGADAAQPDTLEISEIEAESPPPSEVEAYPAAAAAGAAAAGAAAAEPAHAVPEAESATGESTQCPRCGTENRPGLAFCRNCGQRLVAAGVAATVERPGTPEGTQACPRCGTHNRAGVAFCQNCGANLRGTGPSYVPPAVAGEEAPAATRPSTGGAILGPVVLLIGVVGLVTAYLLPFAYGTGSLFEQAWGAGGYGIAFWSGYPADASVVDSAYYGLAAPIPILALLLVALAIGGFMRAAPGRLQTVGLVIALIWSVGLIALFVVVELFGNWDGDIVAMLRALSPAGIILFLTSLIVVIGTLTRFARS